MNTVASTIFSQLGGNRFRVMTGAKHFVTSDNTLAFQLPRAKDGIKAVRITLNSSDTYDVKFMKLGTIRTGYKVTVVKECEGIYADQLEELFENTTGLRTSL